MSVVRPKTDQLTKVQLGLNFGLVGVSCTVSQACVHWVQTTMVRQQLAAMKGDVLNFPSQFAAISRTEGMCGLYRGFSAAACREMSYSSLRFGMYEPVKIMLGAGEPGGPAWKSVTAGLVAGVGAAAVASPTDLLTVRMMKHEGAPLGLGETARALVSEGGFFALYRGMEVTMVRAAILGGTKMATYDIVKQSLKRHGWQEGPSLVFVSSTAVGLALTCTTSPATNARTMIMAHPAGTYSGVLGCMVAIVRTQGLVGLYRGFAAQWLRFAPYNVCQFLVWEQLRKLSGLRPL